MDWAGNSEIGQKEITHIVWVKSCSEKLWLACERLDCIWEAEPWRQQLPNQSGSHMDSAAVQDNFYSNAKSRVQ